MSAPVRLGIFGFPVAHSRSPEMHRAAAEALGIDLEYERFEVTPDLLPAAVRAKHAAGIDGYNVTVPHKQAIVSLLDATSPAADAIGAVNTVVRTDSGYVGHNTDAPGLVRALEEAGVRLADSHIVILGAGGAARAAVVGLAEAGAKQIAVLARRSGASEALAESLSAHVRCPVEAGSLDDAEPRFRAASLIVQATSATLGSSPTAEAFAASLPLELVPAGGAVFDMVYEPRETSVLRAAASHGLRAIDGLGMLLHQGAIAFEMWTGRKPPVEAMRGVLTG